MIVIPVEDLNSECWADELEIMSDGVDSPEDVALTVVEVEMAGVPTSRVEAELVDSVISKKSR